MKARRAAVVGLVAGGVTLALLRGLVLEIDHVSSPSMAPTLLAGDWLLVDRWGWRRDGPARGDIVVFVAPEGSEKLVKRVIGLPGDRVEDDGTTLRVNDTALTAGAIGEVSLDGSGEEQVRPVAFPERTVQEERSGQRRWTVVRLRDHRRAGGSWQVPPGALFVMGDNRDASVDSRDASMGTVPVSGVVGRVARVLFSRGDRGWRPRTWQAVP